MLSLRVDTPPEWLDAVFADFDAFLVDHALCERKASAMGMSLVAKYPDRTPLMEPLIEFAREELEHFHIVYRLVAARGRTLVGDAPDEYVNALRRLSRSGGDALLLDRLLVPGVVEARSCERLALVAAALTDPELGAIYRDLVRAEARHHGLFFRLARELFPAAMV
ncbi:MAG: tRNA-(ms[2]io[6]A)-hydroxylase, partial [Deltaproteobacteria bacterium]|nr:tRNA-(ms[2]io[6]A)-hydroxylase [Deltaproteobacteria bacterium]